MDQLQRFLIRTSLNNISRSDQPSVVRNFQQYFCLFLRRFFLINNQSVDFTNLLHSLRQPFITIDNWCINFTQKNNLISWKFTASKRLTESTTAKTNFWFEASRHLQKKSFGGINTVLPLNHKWFYLDCQLELEQYSFNFSLDRQ